MNEPEVTSQNSRNEPRDESRISDSPNIAADTRTEETASAATNSDEPSDPQPRLADNVSAQNQRVEIALDDDEAQGDSTSSASSGPLVHIRVAAGSNFTRTINFHLMR